MVQGTQRFRQVRATSCVIPYVLCGGLYCLRCRWLFGGGPCPPLYIRGDRVTWKVLAEYSWSPTTIQSDSFLCTAASSMPIRVVTKEIRYIHELSLTLEHSMSISSPAVPGLTTFERWNEMPYKSYLWLSHSISSSQMLMPHKHQSQSNLFIIIMRQHLAWSSLNDMIHFISSCNLIGSSISI